MVVPAIATDIQDAETKIVGNTVAKETTRTAGRRDLLSRIARTEADGGGEEACPKIQYHHFPNMRPKRPLIRSSIIPEQ